MEKYDVVVVGLGAMGSASLYQLSKSGKKLLGIDQFSPPHSLGSSHGDTRVTRQAIGEGEEYVPLVMRSHQIWKELEALTGEKLLHEVGMILMAEKGNKFLETTINSAKRYDIDHEVLSNEELKAQYPQFNITTELGYFEKNAGYLIPEKCIEVQLKLSKQNGANLLLNTKVHSVQKTKDAVKIELKNGDEIFADKVVVTTGAWVNEFLPKEFQDIFTAYRQTLFWVKLNDNYETYKNSPVYLWEFPGREDEGIYGFPAINGAEGGIKVGWGDDINKVSPDNVNRDVSEEYTKKFFKNYIENRLKNIGPDVVRAVTCIYTKTPDYNFVIDHHPETEDILIVSPCSGHGFKHSAAIGEAVSEILTNGKSKLSLDDFKLGRFRK